MKVSKSLGWALHWRVEILKGIRPGFEDIDEGYVIVVFRFCVETAKVPFDTCKKTTQDKNHREKLKFHRELFKDCSFSL